MVLARLRAGAKFADPVAMPRNATEQLSARVHLVIPAAQLRASTLVPCESHTTGDGYRAQARKEVAEMFKTILLPTDGSRLAARAIPYALRLARAPHARLVLVRAYLPPDDMLPLRLEFPDRSRTELAEIDRRQAMAGFEAEVERLRKIGCAVESRFEEGRAADVIFAIARAEHASVVVMATHGRGGIGRCLYGSVADDVIRRMPIPVLLVSNVCNSSWIGEKPGRILVPLDGSRLAAQVLSPAMALADNLGTGEIILLAVVEPAVGVYPDAEVQVVSDPAREHKQANEYLLMVASEMASSAPGPVSYRVEYGDPALTIASVAREQGVDAVAIATHGRSGAARLIVGSVATRTLQLATVPVLVYRPVEVPETVLERAVETAFTRAAP
jgi:nucleotide-binding universal stress UspA family protein